MFCFSSGYWVLQWDFSNFNQYFESMSIEYIHFWMTQMINQKYHPFEAKKKEPKLPIQKLQWRFLCLPQKSIATYMDNAELRQFDISLTISCLVLSFIYLSILINAFVQYMDLFPLLVVCLCISQSKYYIRL